MAPGAAQSPAPSQPAGRRWSRTSQWWTPGARIAAASVDGVGGSVSCGSKTMNLHTAASVATSTRERTRMTASCRARATSAECLVTFAVNKEAPANLRVKLLEKLKLAGFQKCEIKVDQALDRETEAETPATGGADGAADRTAGAAGQQGADAPAGPAAAGPDQPASSGGPAVRDKGNEAPDAAADRRTGSLANNPGAAAGFEPTDRKAVTDRLAALVKRFPSDPASKAKLAPAALAARAALQAGDLAAATQKADELERMLGGPAQGSAGDAPPSGALAGGTSTGSGKEPASAANDAARPMPTGKADARGQAVAPGGRSGARHPHGSPLFDRGRQAWTKTREKVQADIDAVLEVCDHYYGDGSPESTALSSHYAPILAKLDKSLALKLDEVAKNPDGASHAKLVGEAQGIMTQYQAFLDSDPTVAKLDANPLHPVKVRATLDAALKALSNIVQTGSGGTAANTQAGGHTASA